MTLTPELNSLTLAATATSLMWIPYMLSRIRARGALEAMGNLVAGSPAEPGWADRAKRAHANAVENLAVFAPLVLIASAIGTTNAATAAAAQIFVVARLMHYVVYVLGIPVLRTLAFLAGFVCTLVFAGSIFGLVV
jgi:uncharacterized MAPEG superfamily protein